jgi:hypothetical protein
MSAYIKTQITRTDKLSIEPSESLLILWLAKIDCKGLHQTKALFEARQKSQHGYKRVTIF